LKKSSVKVIMLQDVGKDVYAVLCTSQNFPAD